MGFKLVAIGQLVFLTVGDSILTNWFFFCFLLQITEDVARKKTEYQKHLEYYKMLRGRFEEIIKCKFTQNSKKV